MVNERPILTAVVAVLLVAALLAIFWGSLFGTDDDVRGGWKDVDGQRYFELKQGGYAAGWMSVDGQKYYFDEENGCAMVTGWLELEDETFYLGSSGAMTVGWQTVEDATYYFDENGRLQRGWLTLSDGKYYLSETGAMQNGWLEADGKRYYLDENGRSVTGWTEIDDKRYYLDEAGAVHTGWLEQNDSRYYLDADGGMHTGWLEQDGNRYYLKADGTAAKGKLVIEEKTYYFTSAGASILLVNRWNGLDKNYTPEKLVKSVNGSKATPECAAALEKMIADCKAAGFKPQVISSYRSYSYQQMLLDNKMNKGYSYEEAIRSVAVPGTSEHHTGLALDIVDADFTRLNEDQAKRPTQKWLMENCHKYGFIIRYPDDTTSFTGIIYEPWHYRYVGVELATELTELGVCLEQYLDDLTNDGTTCGDPSFGQ